MTYPNSNVCPLYGFIPAYSDYFSSVLSLLFLLLKGLPICENLKDNCVDWITTEDIFKKF